MIPMNNTQPTPYELARDKYRTLGIDTDASSAFPFAAPTATQNISAKRQTKHFHIFPSAAS